MIRRALLAAILFAAAGPSAHAATADDIELFVDVDLTAYLLNKTGAEISFDGYQISAESNALDLDGWYSISDRVAAGQGEELADQLGGGAFGFGEMSPTTSQISEANISGVGILKAGARFPLGKPFGEGGYWVEFFFKVGGIAQQFPGQGVFVPSVPEPSTFLLAGLASLGLAIVRVRLKR
jgi:hypothetical protein